MRAAARALARYHELVRDVPLAERPVEVPTLAGFDADASADLAAAQTACQEKLPVRDGRSLARHVEYLRTEMRSVADQLAAARSSLSSLVVHGSFGASAVLFALDTLTGVVDFDRATYDVLSVDLAYALRSFCFRSDPANPRDMRVGIDRTRMLTFRADYEDVARLPAPDHEALPLVLRAQILLRVAKKCGNFLTKQRRVDQRDKDVDKMCLVFEREARRLMWLSDNEHSLRSP